MGEFSWTPEQRQAIETVDRSVLVSAAAGSGKTAVLSARCAYLVSDAPAPYRCNADELLVVTFTEAAAAEMKHRICRYLTDRCTERPNDRRLRMQVALVDTAHISTLHAFCLWMVRRWFNKAGVDPTAAILDQAEAILLQRETMEDMFGELYQGRHRLSRGFVDLVNTYGLGDDRQIGEFVLSVADFVGSLPNPKEWLGQVCSASESRVAPVLENLHVALAEELYLQRSYTSGVASTIMRVMPEGEFYGKLVQTYVEQLDCWLERLADRKETESIRQEIAAFRLSTAGGPRRKRDEDPVVYEERERAKTLFGQINNNLLRRRLQERLATPAEPSMISVLHQVAPFASCIAELAEEFRIRFARRKRAMSVLDFADLEQLAHGMLVAEAESEQSGSIVRELRQRFRHVLVDEFQDINPLQAQLLSLISREGQGDLRGNLFTVGDVKQSIYRFRLAEPTMFLDREKALRGNAAMGLCVDLQRNYRSNASILEGVNRIFKRLMRAECGGIAYDERAELKPSVEGSREGELIEVHVLERRVKSEDGEEAGGENVDLADPGQWRSVEREAWLIGTRIKAMMSAGTEVGQGGKRRRMKYSDVCVLLRSQKRSAAQMAAIMSELGVPTWSESSGGLFDAREVREVLALLRVMDNSQQDIPLASVLRSGILRRPLDEDDLARIRVYNRDVPFHEAAYLFAEQGPQSALRDDLRATIEQIRLLRRDARVRPLADVLWGIYRDTGYLAYVGGLDKGERRRANLIALHDRARQFGYFRRQGLRRFLQFIQTLQERGEDLASPSVLAEGDDVVRIMSVHKAKGLEFPIVFAADMGRAFNLSDARGRFLLDRKVGIGIKAVDKARMIEYPTALHRWCSRSSDAESRAEELRVWYVAMTRAKERLILVGSSELSQMEGRLTLARDSGTGDVDPLTVLMAGNPLDWLFAALGSMPEGEVLFTPDGGVGKDARFRVCVHEEDEIRRWRLPSGREVLAGDLLSRVSRLDELPLSEPVSSDTREIEELLGEIEYEYPYSSLSSIPVTRSASARGTNAPEEYVAKRERHVFDAVLESGLEAAGGQCSGGDLAAHRGQVVHRVLQFMCHDRVASAVEIAEEIRRLVSEGVISEDEAELIDVECLEWFFATDLGKRVVAAGESYHREWMFLMTEPAEPGGNGLSVVGEDKVLVRGVVDGILDSERTLEVIDFKTDKIHASETAARATEYEGQMASYCTAVSKVFGRKVSGCYLVFLHGRMIVESKGCRVE